MLEFIIKQNENEIGRLQFDPAWHTFDVVMNMLGGYVVKEFAPNRAASEDSSMRNTISKELRSVEDVPSANLVAGMTQNSNSNQTFTANSSSAEIGLSDRDYVVFSKRASGRRHALKFRGKVINGNMVAGLVALYKRGEPIDEPRDLLTALRRDTRFETTSEKSAVGTVRNFLSNLIGVKLVEKLEDGSYTITELGGKVARLMDVSSEPSS